MKNRPIPPEVVDEVWEELHGFSPHAFSAQVERIVESQPELFGFLGEAGSDLSEQAEQMALFLGVVVYRAFEKAFGNRIPEVPAEVILMAFQKNVAFLEQAAELDEDAPEGPVFSKLKIDQPALMRFVGECLFEQDEDEPQLPEGNAELLFLVMKTFIDALDRHVASRRAKKSRRKRGKAPAPVYQIKVTLKGIRPPIWRRLLVPSDTTLDRLHDVIQIAMGWENAHLHQFIAGRQVIGEPNPELGNPFGPPAQDERTVALGEVLRKEKDKILYQYDFGDSWEHEIRLEKVLAPDPDLRHPVCVKARRACPPEDCGGPWGYADLLEALADPEHPEHEAYLEWLPEDWVPEKVDLERINEALRSEFGE